ncbi:hypothetical protein NQ317_006419 [Molorchus minor]|uniref:Uncharacterized protein n=1 Tax=Molorchus minor TaxID=1323400 RepID=A0ABQ9JZ29_9CUCU|nr:hypothetical protein NQ317_006419 [Molorchus minor]
MCPPNSRKGCKQVSSDNDESNCFVCENPKTNAKYTQCSYKSKKEPVNFYQGNSAKYSMPQKGESGRYKRYAGKDEDTDPYTFIKK